MTEGFCLIIAIPGLIGLILERKMMVFMMYLHMKFHKLSYSVSKVMFFTF
jgi:hypothetical protein